jgi:uncharacterized membrane protein
MEAKQVDLERGRGWLADGWSLFMKSPVIWVLMSLIIVVAMVVLLFLPLLGPLAIGLLGTMLAGGLIYGASQLDSGGELEVMQLFQAFKDASRTGPMLVLGVIALVAGLIMGIVSEGLIGNAFIGGMIAGTTAIEFSVTALFGLLLMLLMTAAMAAIFAYAIPLVMLQNVAPFDAIQFSAMGSLRNWQPFLVFGLICTVLSILAAPTFGLGFLILGPIIAGAWYQSYKDLFGS